MPIHVHAEIRHLDQDEFGRIAYAVMDHAFAVHDKMGRFFDEDIYRDEVAARIGKRELTQALAARGFASSVDGRAVGFVRRVRWERPRGPTPGCRAA